MNRLKARAAAAALLVTIAALAGCSSSRNMVTVQESTSITKGRELTDLRRALEAQAVNQAEYEQLRRVILDRPN